jgi:tetratricopeptide (TPR) repeat protein
VTTGSVEALKKYTTALQANARGDYPRALALLREAIGIDSTFAMAYRQLNNSTGNMRSARAGLGGIPHQSENDVWIPASTKLYALRDRLPRRERLQALDAYYTLVVGDQIKALAAADTLLSEFPNTPGALNAIAASHWTTRREFARAESAYAHVIGSEPTTPFAYFNIAGAQLAQGKYAAARASFDRARRQFPEINDARIPDLLYHFGLVDSAEAITRAQATVGNVLTRLGAENRLSILAARRGRMREARAHLADVRALERERGEPSGPLEDSLLAAQFEIAFFQHPAAAVRILDQALAQTPLESIRWVPLYLRVASLYAQADRADKARALLTAYDRAVSDTAQRRRDQPGRDAALGYLALAEQRPRDAVAAFRRSDRRADGPVNSCAVCVDPSIGLAFDRARMPDSAIAALEHFVNAPSVGRQVADAWNLHWALRRLGELHETRGDRADAVHYYQMFVDLWRNADPELQPEVSEVKRRLAHLSR